MKVARFLLARQWRCNPSKVFLFQETSTLSKYRNPRLLGHFSSTSDSDRPDPISETPERIHLLTEKVSCASKNSISDDLRLKLSVFAEELLSLPDEGDVDSLLYSKSFLHDNIMDAAPFLELLFLLSGRPLLALKVLVIIWIFFLSGYSFLRFDIFFTWVFR